MSQCVSDSASREIREVPGRASISPVARCQESADATGETPQELLRPYYRDEGGALRISAERGSRFAKEVAGDHNPIHDAEAPRFCVPGDLLFALVLQRYGAARELALAFRGLLRADTPLQFPDIDATRFPSVP